MTSSSAILPVTNSVIGDVGAVRRKFRAGRNGSIHSLFKPFIYP